MRTQLSRAPRFIGRSRRVPRTGDVGVPRRRPAGVAPLPAGRRPLQVELEGQRLVRGAAGPLRTLVELVEEGGQLPLPAPPVVGCAAAVLVAHRDEQREGVLAAVVHGAAAPPEDPDALAVDADAEPDGVRRARRAAHRALDVEVAVGVDRVLAGEHLAAADVVPGPVEGRRAVAAAQVLVGQQRGQVDHARQPTSRRRPGCAITTVCRKSGTPHRLLSQGSAESRHPLVNSHL